MDSDRKCNFPGPDSSKMLITMKTLPFLIGGVAALTPALFLQTDGKADVAGLKKMVENMGYETKMLNSEVGKEKFEFKITKGGFDVPIGAEVSASGNYIWFTVFLGEAGNDTLKHSNLLKENAKIQPNFFYITSKGSLMLGVATDNRGITPTVVKRITDKLSDDVGGTSKVWQGDGE